MGGLQSKLINRSKNIQGHYVLKINRGVSDDELNRLKNLGIVFTREFELELLLKYKTYLTPVVVHGVDSSTYLPDEIRSALDLFEDDKAPSFNGIILPMQLAFKVGVLAGDSVSLISPIHVDTFLSDIPRSVSAEILNTVNFDVPEFDGFHLWVNLSKIQNLIRQKRINTLRIYTDLNPSQLVALNKLGELKSWEKMNQALVYALNLESTVMIFLFGAMSLLVSFCISSGLLIFFNKVRMDLSSFWILGLSPDKLYKGTTYFLFFLIAISLILGLFFASVFLILFKTYGTEILPDVFIDRKIPVYFTFKAYFISFVLPFCISLIFIRLALKNFKNDSDHLQMVRSVGN